MKNRPTAPAERETIGNQLRCAEDAEYARGHYNMLYANFLGRADGVANFMEFLRGARQIYWQMGDSLSKLSHAVNCWSLAVRSHRDKLLPPDRLQALLDIMNLILVQDHRVVAGEDAA